MLAQGQSSSAKRGGLAEVSSGVIFLKKKKKKVSWSENRHEGQRRRLRGSSARKNAHNGAAELLREDATVSLQTQALQLLPPASPGGLWTSLVKPPRLPGWSSHSTGRVDSAWSLPHLTSRNLRIWGGHLTGAVPELPGRLGR